ncbi:hypothetical protein FAZ95_13940 [Trinickia violacea]|uniref:Uncharacterized protein n=1 Tax=Trinickia violacea TaxID=2571746 RepID=A0A4P8IT19_9BURK|nr:hypothetical protein [Trinickia violacea]QCP50184.1 hypothetical protein FAZ95_13940 [Trinickia violacea]
MAENMTIYIYRSPFGLLSIRGIVEASPRWLFVYEAPQLASNGEMLLQPKVIKESYPSPEAVAEAVFQQRIGWPLWDELPYVSFPASLEDWTAVEASGTTTIRGSD